MQFGACRTDSIGQRLFDIHVNIFELVAIGKGPFPDLSLDLVEAVENRRLPTRDDLHDRAGLR